MEENKVKVIKVNATRITKWKHMGTLLEKIQSFEALKPLTFYTFSIWAHILHKTFTWIKKDSMSLWMESPNISYGKHAFSPRLLRIHPWVRWMISNFIIPISEDGQHTKKLNLQKSWWTNLCNTLLQLNNQFSIIKRLVKSQYDLRNELMMHQNLIHQQSVEIM